MLWGGAANGTCIANASCAKLFKAIARKAAYRRWKSRDAESWQLWLDFMRREGWGYSDVGSPQAVPPAEWEEIAKSGKLLCDVQRELGHSTSDEAAITEVGGWLQDGVIEHVFKASADFCVELDSPEKFGSPNALAGKRVSKIPERLLFSIIEKEEGTPVEEATFEQLLGALDTYRSAHPEAQSVPVRGRRWKALKRAYLEEASFESNKSRDRRKAIHEKVSQGWHRAKQGVLNPPMWRRYRKQFKRLAHEEDSGIKSGEFKSRLWTSDGDDGVQSWFVHSGDSMIASHFLEVATRAGHDLGCPAEIEPADFWQFCVFFYLRETDNREIFLGGANGDDGGALLKPLKASAELCSWLARKALNAEMKSSLESPTGDHVSSEEKNAVAAENVFRCTEGFWAVTFERKTVHLGDMAGLKYICELLRRPRTEIEAAALSGSSQVLSNLGSCGDADENENKLSVVAPQCRTMNEVSHLVEASIPMSDEKTIEFVTTELHQRKAELADLPENNWVRKGELCEEINKLEEYLREVKNDRGQPRKIAGTAQRSRTAVTNAIRRAIARISTIHPALGDHLRRYIKTGTAVIYLPDRLPDWHF